jgi:hypothetical protein
MTPAHRGKGHPMLRGTRAPWLALVVVLVGLATTAATSQAAIEFRAEPGGSIEMRSEGRLTFTSGATRVACRITFRGRLSTSAVSTTSGTRLGEITGARIEECEGGTLERALVSEREAWELKVNALLGSLPESITGLLIEVSRVKLLFSTFGRSSRCLYEATLGILVPLTQAEEFGFTTGTGRLLSNTFRLSSGPGCPESGRSAEA